MTRHPAANGLSSAPRAASSATSTSTMARTQASSANATDFFNSLLERTVEKGPIQNASYILSIVDSLVDLRKMSLQHDE